MAKKNESKTSKARKATTKKTVAKKAQATAGKYKVKRQLILPVLRMEQHTPIYVKITDAIYTGKQMEQTGKKAAEKPADLCHVVNLETGEEAMIIVPAILKSVLEEQYPEAGYVGCGFSITKGEKPDGKRYFKYNISELEL